MTHSSREPRTLFLLGLAVFIWSGIAPADRMVWVMEVIPSVVGVVALAATYRRFPMTMLTYRLIFLFSLILFVGGKYTYAEVPIGYWVKDLFHLQRNHFDRLGHFFQGIVPAILTREMLIRCTPLRPGKAVFWICCSVSLAVSAGYELIEWWSAVLTAPEQGTAFLGTQGDVWDAQKDMLMAFIGALFVQLAFSRVHDRQLAALPSAPTS